MNIEDSNIVITGASRGLGRALAESLAGAGARVVAVARDPEPLRDVVARIRDAGGVAHAIAADVGDKRAVHPIAGRAAALVGGIHVLINNASTLGPTPLRSLLDTECEDLERVLAVNLIGPFRLTRIIAGAMALRGAGLVINISSDAAIEAYPGWGAYGTSKAALDHLSRIWAAELAERGVRILAIDPGEMDTAMHAAAIPDADRSELVAPAVVAERIARLIAEVPEGARVSAEVAA